MTAKTKFIVEATALTLAAFLAIALPPTGLPLGLILIAVAGFLVCEPEAQPRAARSLALLSLVALLLLTTRLHYAPIMALCRTSDLPLVVWKLVLIALWWSRLRTLRRRHGILLDLI